MWRPSPECANLERMGADVIVVGGGVIGCAVALRLAQAGATVTVIERSTPGSEASTAAAGILSPQTECGGPGPMLELGLQSRKMYPAFAEELKELSGVDVGYLPSGVLICAYDENNLPKLHTTVAWQRAMGLRVEVLSGNQVRDIEPELSPHIVMAGHYPDDHQVDNRLLLRALAIAVERAGVKIQMGTIRSVVMEKDRAAGVDVDGTVFRADAIVVAAGAWSALIAGLNLDPQTVRPAKGQMLQLQLGVPVVSHIVGSDEGYIVPRADGRVIIGGTVEFVGFDRRVTADGVNRILGAALRLCPALGGAQITDIWCGFRPYSEGYLPLLGPGPYPGLFFATGHFRNGILLAPITAQLVSQAVLGQTPDMDLKPFLFSRLDRPTEPYPL
jgi:glycine oxidase